MLRLKSFRVGRRVHCNSCGIFPSTTDIYTTEESVGLHNLRPVGLLFEEHEAIDVLTRYTLDGKPSLSADLKELFLITSGHVGMLVSLLSILAAPKVSFSLIIHRPGVTFIKSNINFYIGTSEPCTRQGHTRFADCT